MEITTIAVIGAGNLGSRIALRAALSGFSVNIYDISQDKLKQAKSIMSQVLENHNDFKNLSIKYLNNLTFTVDLDHALSEADLVSENVTEDLEVKKRVWEAIGNLAEPHTLFTTNTSYLLPSDFAEISGRPSLFCAFHFHDVFESRVVDIMPHPGTAPEVLEILEEFGRTLHQVPLIVQKEHSGYIFNTLLISWIDAAGRLLTGEIAEVEAIDKSWMVNFNMPVGPFGVLDKVGLDTAWKITSARRNPASRAFAELLKHYVDQGKLGVKSGEGFYSYPDPSYKSPDFLR
ncbi:3-hydroxyacyl-CoA dehydrogenase NAD-binding domain-containing protein [Algoriphagus halophytocola]|uniref:3-hydroxyacyl-CoA dehydrogenase NAD-binding domain-containing protein n=1 Tax=Algoriphagus halophytocola TaxID=2991499 RepID=A0ABY6MJC8_9BACT|nr:MULTISPECIES: 3-hydroxyacyl-CoA dehydrogenase NAD-binding domain-containing protein [unclassified Algoriphagus]UZD23748.1 3-hydroxyacyl-CoA dehydrogenase NAD-binding domain-containing protein [Algoriphagus sp. TR-M5]WBL45042.1 3-hydroxyacyl-CoA dehydrogenase NAD-binding domain-containing protein [Algoriphagus sp. TR-M9]